MAKASATETRSVRYDEDLYAWSQEQAALLRARRADCLDWDHLANISRMTFSDLSDQDESGSHPPR